MHECIGMHTDTHWSNEREKIRGREKECRKEEMCWIQCCSCWNEERKRQQQQTARATAQRFV